MQNISVMNKCTLRMILKFALFYSYYDFRFKQVYFVF